jgi:hypothetical protein
MEAAERVDEGALPLGRPAVGPCAERHGREIE